MGSNQSTINKRESNKPASKYRVTKKYSTTNTKRKPKRSSATLNPLHRDCFKTTGIIIGEELCLQITHVLIDSGATSCFVSLKAAREAKLTITSLSEGKSFTSANGQISFDKTVCFQLSIASIRHEIEAFVDESVEHLHLLLGIPAIEKFRMNFHPRHHPKKRDMAVPVRSDVPGQGRK